MGFARKHLFDPSETNVCHCISRCVRRERLLESEERRTRLMDRMRQLTQSFALDVLEAAVMHNHLHVVTSTSPEMARSWSDAEVARRFRTLCPDYALRKRLKIKPDAPVSAEEVAAAVAKPALIAKWREDLASVSFFHKLLKQKIAWQWNREDNVTGQARHGLGEGRFKSIVVLDDEAIIAHMVYVALNPVRAGIAASLDDYKLSTIAERVDDLKRRIAQGEFADEAAAARERLRSVRLVPAMPCEPGEDLSAKPVLESGAPNPWFGGRVPSIIEGSGLAAYLHDTDAQGRVAAVGKTGCIPASTPPVLAMLDAEITASLAEDAKSSTLMQRARAIAAEIDGLIREESVRIWGNFSGSAESVAKHARKMKRQFALAITGGPGGGGARRIRAAPEDDDGGAAAAAALAEGAALAAVT